MSLFGDITPVYVQAAGVTPNQPSASLTPNYVQPDGTVIPSSEPASWWQRLFGGDVPVYVPAPPPPQEPRGCNDGGVIEKGQGEATTSRRRTARAATVTPSPFETTPTGTTTTG